MIQYYLNGGPNPRKVTLLLEELGLPYQPVRVDTSSGEQHEEAFAALNPNRKVPVLIEGDVTLFDSNAILLYLAEREGRFLGPAGPAGRGQLLSWLMFIATGLGPYCGQAVHFQLGAPERIPYALQRYAYEARRHFAIIEDRLAGRDWLLDDYSILDMALWGWATFLDRVLDGEGADAFPRVRAFVERVNARPAAQRALAATASDGRPPPRVHANPHLFRYLAPAN